MENPITIDTTPPRLTPRAWRELNGLDGEDTGIDTIFIFRGMMDIQEFCSFCDNIDPRIDDRTVCCEHVKLGNHKDKKGLGPETYENLETKQTLLCTEAEELLKRIERHLLDDHVERCFTLDGKYEEIQFRPLLHNLTQNDELNKNCEISRFIPNVCNICTSLELNVNIHIEKVILMYK